MIKFIPFIKNLTNEIEPTIFPSTVEQGKITRMFLYLTDPSSFISVLQKNYNHSYHFTTTNSQYDFCEVGHWQELVRKANSTDPNDILYVEGTKHSNYHTSFVVRNAFTGAPELCKDTYIRVMDPSQPKRIYHILTTFPETKHPFITFHPNPYYPLPNYIIGIKPNQFL
jgi:hypothetical protein